MTLRQRLKAWWKKYTCDSDPVPNDLMPDYESMGINEELIAVFTEGRAYVKKHGRKNVTGTCGIYVTGSRKRGNRKYRFLKGEEYLRLKEEIRRRNVKRNK